MTTVSNDRRVFTILQFLFINFEGTFLNEISQKGVWNEINYALLSFFPRNMNLCLTILSIAHAFMHLDLVQSAGSAGKSTVPNEVKRALIFGIVIRFGDKLGEIVYVLVAIHVALISNMTLVLNAFISQAVISTLVLNVVAGLFVMAVIEGAHIVDPASKVLEHSEILQILSMIDQVKVFILILTLVITA